MKKKDKIVIMSNRVGFNSTSIKERCPFKKEGKICNILSIECKYAYTELRVPKECPLLAGPVTTTVSVVLGFGDEKK